jgi:methylenetetrahydrofolate dehydrogenase (NADP+)/methenyltetrahydrofolate cyclohydrolase
MTARIINGRDIAAQIKKNLKDQIVTQNLDPCLAVILIGDDPASQVYVTHKQKACKEIGIQSHVINLPIDTDIDTALSHIHTLNNDNKIHGILLQLPVPSHLNANILMNTISQYKDVDGLNPINLGKLMNGQNSFIPCTPHAVLKLLQTEHNDLSGKHAIIIGRSLLFGKPMGQLLLQANCTVTQCHSKTINIQDHTKQADIIICATGQAKMIKGHWLKKDCTVIDVGITRMNDGTLCGDVDFDSAKNKVAAITPVPGGVGPMTIACLLENTIKATVLSQS